MSKIKLAILMNKMSLGGTEKALINFLNYIDNDTFETTLLLLEPSGELIKEIPSHIKTNILEGSNFAKEILSKNPFQNFINLVKTLKFKEALQLLYTYILIKLQNQWYKMIRYASHKIISNEYYDICIAYPGPNPLISYICLEKIKSKQKIQFIHSDVRKTFNDLGFGKKFYHKFDKIICVSKDSARHFKVKYPKCTNIKILENIINNKEIVNLANKGNSFNDNVSVKRILTVARLSEEKGVKLIPEIIQNLLDSNTHNFKWYIIGTGPVRDFLSKLIKTKKYDNYLVLLGSKINPYPYMKDCDIYVQPSLFEGYGISVAEVKIFNKPIIITNFSNAKYLITNNQTGIITDIEVKELSNQLKRLLSDVNLQQKFAQNLIKENARIENTNYSKIISSLLIN